ncbi:MAG: hypothetical protein ACLPVW_01770 [Terriglobales bacterium]
MNDMPFPRRFPWLPAMAILAFSGALFLCDWLVWTPMQRYYLGTYLRCALLGTNPASSTEVRWLYKTAPHKQQELATDADVVPATAGDDRGIPMQLSPAARQAGWTGLLQGSEEWLQTVRLQLFLEAQFYDGKSFWRLLLTPLLWGAAMFFFLLAGGSILRSLNAYDQWDLERIEWGEPPTSWPQRWRKKVGRMRFSLPGFAMRKIPEIARTPTPQAQASIHAESLKKPIQPVLPIFGATIDAATDRPKEHFASKETKRIE